MDVSNPEKLVRGMYGDPDRPVIEQDNDIETPFSGSGEGAIPQHLQELLQQPRSVDPEVEEIPQVHTDLTVDTEKVFEENSQSRFQILDLAIKKPGVCALCGSSGGDGRQFVDFGKSVEWYGVVYFCTFCVSEAAKLLGLGNVQISEEFASELNRKLGNVHSENYELKEQLNAARILLRTCTCTDTHSGLPAAEIPEADIVELEYTGDDDESSSGDESDADESDSFEGPNDLPAIGSDDVESEPAKPVRRSRKSTG